MIEYYCDTSMGSIGVDMCTFHWEGARDVKLVGPHSLMFTAVASLKLWLQKLKGLMLLFQSAWQVSSSRITAGISV